MWLEVSVGLGPKLTGFGAVGTFGFSCTCTAVACSRVLSNAASESFGLAAESMLSFRRAFSHSRVRTSVCGPRRGHQRKIFTHSFDLSSDEITR